MLGKNKLEKEIKAKKAERKLAIDRFFANKKEGWNDWWKQHSLLKKVLFTILVATLFLAAGTITIPGVHLQNENSLTQGNFFGILNLVGGGGLRRFSIVALGIGPFISASLVMMILQTKLFPPIHRLSQSGPQGRIKINFITFFITLVFSIVQSILITKALINTAQNQSFGIKFGPEVKAVFGQAHGEEIFAYFVLPTFLIAGSFFTLFLSEQITNKGVGNGTSIIIFVGIASGLYPTFKAAFEFFVPSGTSNINIREIINFSIYILAYAITILVIVIFTIAERRIPIQQVGAGLSKTEKELSYLPIKANPAGIMSVIFAMMILSVPTLIANLVGRESRFSLWVNNYFQLTHPLGFFLFVIITFGLTLLLGIQQSKIDKISEDFAKSSTFIPGIKPGDQTESYLLNVVLRLSFFSSIYLLIMGSMQFIQQMFGMPANIAFGGTSVMILVSTAYETIQQVKARYKSQELARKRRIIRELKEMYGEEEEDLIW